MSKTQKTPKINLKDGNQPAPKPKPPKLAKVYYYAGSRLKMGNLAHNAKRIHDKFARRMIRKMSFAERSRIGKKLFEYRIKKFELAKLADNSHERQRFYEADRIERREGRLAK